MAEKTRKRVQRMATEVGYTPNLLARAFLTGRSGTLGLLTFKIDREMFGRQADWILRAAGPKELPGPGRRSPARHSYT